MQANTDITRFAENYKQNLLLQRLAMFENVLTISNAFTTFNNVSKNVLNNTHVQTLLFYFEHLLGLHVFNTILL